MPQLVSASRSNGARSFEIERPEVPLFARDGFEEILAAVEGVKLGEVSRVELFEWVESRLTALRI